MRWSIQIGRIFGIPIKVHITFLLLLLFVAIAGGQSSVGNLAGVVLVCLIFACVVLHELGHSIIAIGYGLKVRDITLLPIGGVASMEDMPEKPSQEIAIALAGPAVSVALTIFFYLLARATNNVPDFRNIQFGRWNFIPNLFYINFLITIFNLIPAFPLDGGRVLRGALATVMHPLRATHIAVSVGQGFAILFFFLGIFVLHNIWLALIALFIYIGGEAEERATRLRLALADIPVSDVMLTDIDCLSPDDTLGSVLERIFHGAQEDFPVVERGALVGVLPRSAIIAAAHDKPKSVLVRDIMEKDFSPVMEDEPLFELFRKMMDKGLSAVPVVRGDSLAGLINLDQIAKYQMFYLDPTLRKLLDHEKFRKSH